MKVISRDNAHSLIAQGVGCIPMQWIDTDKNEHMRKPGGPYVPPLHKARLMARGDLEKGVARNHSPTADQEGLSKPISDQER